VDTTREGGLAKFLVQRASENDILGSYFYWYITVECADPVYSSLYKKIGLDFQNAMMKVPLPPAPPLPLVLPLAILTPTLGRGWCSKARTSQAPG
jgi:hypothetical protein